MNFTSHQESLEPHDLLEPGSEQDQEVARGGDQRGQEEEKAGRGQTQPPDHAHAGKIMTFMI